MYFDKILGWFFVNHPRWFENHLSFTNSWSSLKLTSIESVMPSSHLILCCPLLLLPQSLSASGSFPMSQLLAWGGQSTAVSALASFLPKNTQDWSLEWTGWISLQSKGLSTVFSNITVQKHQFFGAQLSSQSNSHIHTWLLEMVTHSSILAWRIPWTEKPGRLQSTGPQRVRHDWTTSLSFPFTFFTSWATREAVAPRMLEWEAYPFSSGSSQPRNWTGVSCIAGEFFTNWAIREANSLNQGKQLGLNFIFLFLDSQNRSK